MRLVFLLIACIQTYLSVGQPTAFTQTTCYAGYTYTGIVNKPFNQYTPQPGATIGFGLNIKKSWLNFQATYIPFEAKNLPAFNSYLVTLGYQKQYTHSTGWYVSGGVKLGNHIMQFNDKNVQDNLITESELLLGYGLQTGWQKHKLGVFAACERNITYTLHRFTFLQVNAGIRYQLNTPKLLNRFIQ